jgi:predicted phage terminase large subunit-like protein
MSGRRATARQDMDPAEADQLASALMRTRFDYFVEGSFRSLYPGVEFCRETYLEPLCFALQTVLNEDSSRLLVNTPPRHLKSFTASICLPAFALGHNPRLKFNVVSYSHELGREHTSTFNRLIALPWFRRLFPALHINSRLDQAVTSLGGVRKAVAIGGALTGFGQSVLILDDLIKAQDVSSVLAREEVLRFYQGSALTRFDDPRRTKIIAIQQRLHVEDFTSHLVENARFKHLDLPSIMRRDLVLPIYDNYEFGWAAGNLLSPTRFPQEELDRLRMEMGTHAFSAQFLNDPQPDGSMIVDLRRLHLIDQPFDRNRLQLVALSIDTAVKDTDQCDYSVIATWGFDGAQWCLMDVLRERLEFPELIGATRAMIAKWNAKRILIEDSHTGAALWQSVKRTVDKGSMITPHGSKIERMSVCTERLYSGRYVIPKSEPWFDTVMSELRAFPHGRHDDFVDTLSQFLGWVRLGREDVMIDTKHGRRRRRP